MIHTPVDSVKVRQPLELQAELPPDAKADSVRVYFRRQGQTKFRSIAMDLQGDAYVARVPGKYVRTTSMQYYIEARNKGQKRPVAVAGTRRTPHIVVIDGGKPPSALPKSTDTIRSPSGISSRLRSGRRNGSSFRAKSRYTSAGILSR